MRIKCPECGAAISISMEPPKPGTYRIECKSCQQAFRLRIGDEVPPRVSLNKLVEKATIASDAETSLASDHGEIPERLGGYKILRLLGKGAMGSVYEARQLSLDRLVALKTIRGRLAENPSSLARFAREAYAAAQLTHHNIVQIYDFGEDSGRYFFSMEWVRGGPLDRLIREHGALEPKRAAGYTLQAARGLQYAHRNGMVHRDIKPANLLLGDDGVIKVADLGLVKIPDLADGELGERDSALSGMSGGTQVTLQGTAVGTPAFMAPEQGIDAAAVDHRADIYSLGCSLFCMLTGHPPFDGAEISEVLEQHARKPLPSLRQSDPRIPESLERVVAKATAKRPSDRYDSVSEMIEDLESFLGVRSEGKFSPSRPQADAWESIASTYSSVSTRQRFAQPVVGLWSLACALTTVLLPMLYVNAWVLGPVIWLASIFTASSLASHAGRSPLAQKFRAWLGSMSWTDWGIGSIGILIGLVVLCLLGWWPGLIGGLLLGGLAGSIYHLLIVTPLQADREQSLQAAQRFVRDLRIDGADEQGLREFIARYSGGSWRCIFEEMFGYDALCQMQAWLAGDSEVSAPTWLEAIHDRVCHWFSARTKANLQSRDRGRLAALEAKSLTSEGLGSEEASRRAWQIAEAIVANARSVTPMTSVLGRSEEESRAAQEKRIMVKAMLADARSGRYRKQPEKLASFKRVFSGQSRLLLGCLLLIWFAVAGRQHGIFDPFQNLNGGSINLEQVGSAIRDATTAAVDRSEDQVVSPSAGSRVWSLGIAGLLMILSAFVSGWRMTPFAVVATLLILLGASIGIPSVGPLPAWIVSALAGLFVYLPGIVFGETREEA